VNSVADDLSRFNLKMSFRYGFRRCSGGSGKSEVYIN